MENNFKKVHTSKDLTISSIFVLAGIGLSFVNAGLGIFLTVCGIIMLLIYKDGYKKDGKGVVLTRKSEDLCRDCEASIVDFLNGKDVTPRIKKGNNGGIVHLNVLFNEKEGIAYARLYEYCNYSYEPVTEVVELHSPKAEIIISQL